MSQAVSQFSRGACLGFAEYLITLWALSTVYVGIDTWGHQRYEHQIQTVLVEHSEQLAIYDGLDFNVDLVCCAWH